MLVEKNSQKIENPLINCERKVYEHDDGDDRNGENLPEAQASNQEREHLSQKV